ncbi:LuxR C-terminal-related transcriptional regulator [Pseudonocardia kunmingensis]|uniref:LuxR family maltose regulon positive regulatory protein n=1 Tax=Pseudonocardia kunmingensis TaxID=630975 RepID=A0A543DWE5_9PSEU|nr:LuxR C-terminal-related transcriptional regulator [Pseudonocardia kunmingensis]TQM13635.1 LuxR family maltose regulon positive regulatory protein [Pseudonocardia kunmingensis]
MTFVPDVKIAIPSIPPEFVVRSELRASLEAARAAEVVLVCAPAGHGKTLLLADWARTSTSADTAWVALDRDDNDPRRLWASVVASVLACAPVPSTSRLHQPPVWRADAQPEFLAELVDALGALPRPIRLVLDDVHELVDADALHGLQILSRNRCPGVQLVLSSRFDPPLSLPRLRLAGRLHEVRAAQLRFSRSEAEALLEGAGLHLEPAEVDLLHRRTGGWAAGLRLAASGAAAASDPDAFLDRFSGDERSVADYLVGEVLSGFPDDVQEFLRLISISEPVPTGLAAELSGRQDAGCLLDRLEHDTALVSSGGRHRDSYRIQQLLRAYLRADLNRHGVERAAELHRVAARWWADRLEPVPALEHAAQGQDLDLLTDLLHRFAVPLIAAGNHGPLRRALATAGAQAVGSDPWLALTSALAHLEAGELITARGDLARARRSWPAHDPAGLAVLRAVAEQFSAAVDTPIASVPVDPVVAAVVTENRELPVEPELEALAHLSRGTAGLGREDLATARAEFEAALHLSRDEGFDYLMMQSLVLLAVVAGSAGDVRTMRTMSGEARAAAAEHGWTDSSWSSAATAMLAYAALMRTETSAAERLAVEALGLSSTASSPQLWSVLRGVHGAAVFDAGGRAAGLAELQQTRAEFGDRPADAQPVAALAMLEFRAALLLGHSTAARTVRGWLADRSGETAELMVMQAWTDAAGGRPEHARSVLRPVLHDGVGAVLAHTLVDAWLLEASLAVAHGDRPAARSALQGALGVAEPLDALRPFLHAGSGVRELLVHQLGTFGAFDGFAEHALTAGRRGAQQRHAMLSERELTVLGLLPSMLSLDEIADDLTVSVNTVKSHVRSIYTKLGVSSRRLAVLTAHEHGLLTTSLRQV